MELKKFTSERNDNKNIWKDQFRKSDIVFTNNTDYNSFKSELANYLFETQHSKLSLQELIEGNCEEEFGKNAELINKALNEFLILDNRPSFNTKDTSVFINALKKYLLKKDLQGLDVDCVCETINKILLDISSMLRESFVKLQVTDSEEDRDSLEFGHMTGQLGEILATLTFQQYRNCGDLVRAKIVPDNPNMPRHGEDLIGFSFNPENEAMDILYLVESKSTKNSVSSQIDQIADRFSNYLKGIPYYEINRLKLDIQQKMGGESRIPRKRITRLLVQVRKNPNHNQIVAGAFLHFPSNYSPRDSTFSKLGDIKIEKEDGSVIKMDASRIHLITFTFDDFENTVKEIFEKAWTI